MKKINRTIPLLIFSLILIGSVQAFAADERNPTSITKEDFLFYFTLGAVAFILLTVVYMWSTLKTFLAHVKYEQADIAKKEASVWSGLTDAVPIEEEEEILFHHEYDGIRELDNNLPPWWVAMFYATIIFSFAYLGYYHLYDGDLQEEEYKNEIALAEVEKAKFLKSKEGSIDENTVELLTDNAKIESGKSLFVQNCAACHGQLGEGGVGPNLADEYWIHGGGIKDIFKSIKYGIPQKGMISWKSQLSAGQIQEVSSFIVSIKGSNPPNGKEPQGELVK